MKEQYIKQVEKELSLTRKAKKENVNITEDAARLISVSYTHLDVYKRQRCNGTHGCQCTDAVTQMADDLYGGYAPKQGCFGCLPKVLHDAKPVSYTHL